VVPGWGHREEEVGKMAMSPFRGRGFYDLHSEMNRMFDEMLGGLTRGRSGRQQGVQATEWAPSVDVFEKEGNLVIRAELPGVKQEDVDISVQDRVLTISGQRKEEQEQEQDGYYVRERRQGTFRRSVMLPQGVDESNIRARYEDGVLEVTVEGAAAVREPRRIQIEGSDGGGGSGAESSGG
jgi:HSP20 family protein